VKKKQVPTTFLRRKAKKWEKKLLFLFIGTLINSVADPGCLSRIPDPDFYPSRIPDLGSRIQKQQQKRGVKKICCHTFFL
jgi:hypothetical protein